MPGAPRRGRGRPGQSPSPTVCAHRSRTCFRDPKEVTGDLHEGARGGPSALLCVWGRGGGPTATREGVERSFAGEAPVDNCRRRVDFPFLTPELRAAS